MATHKDAQDEIALMRALQRCAGEILALPSSKREARYNLSRRTHLEEALNKMEDRAKAEELASKMDEWLRWIVCMTETTVSREAAAPRAWPPAGRR